MTTWKKYRPIEMIILALFILGISEFFGAGKVQAFPLKPVLRDIGHILLDAALGGGSSNQGDSSLSQPLTNSQGSQDSYQFLQPELAPSNPNDPALQPQALPQPYPQSYPSAAPTSTTPPGNMPVYPSYPSYSPQQVRQILIFNNF
jgi:hypothetical protein